MLLLDEWARREKIKCGQEDKFEVDAGKDDEGGVRAREVLGRVPSDAFGCAADYNDACTVRSVRWRACRARVPPPREHRRAKRCAHSGEA